jgi:putative transposase
MLLAHKIALVPNNKQTTYFAKASGVARFAYNWALGEWKREFGAGGKPSDAALRKRLNAAKREQFPWMFEVTKCAPQEAIINLGVGFSNFFRDCKKPKAQRRFHYPKPKKKGFYDSFCAANEAATFRCDGKRVKLPVVGWVRMREALCDGGPPRRQVVRIDTGRNAGTGENQPTRRCCRRRSGRQGICYAVAPAERRNQI